MGNCGGFDCGVYDVGCYSHCTDIILPIYADATGIHTLVYEFNGTKNYYDFFAETGGQIKLCDPPFNEDSCVCFSINKPCGDTYSYNLIQEGVLDKEYNRFNICIKFGFDRTALYDNQFCDGCVNTCDCK